MSIRDTDQLPKPITRLGDDGIVYHDLTDLSHLSVDLMRFLYGQRLRLTGKARRPVVMLAQHILTVDFEVQLFASHPQIIESTEAVAIVGTSFMLRHLTSMFLSYHAPGYPVALFDEVGEAKEWVFGGVKSSIKPQA